MPEFYSPPQPPAAAEEELQFPPVTRAHILQCSYDAWFPKYRKVCIKSRIIPLPAEFVEYLREDGILLSDEKRAGEEDDDDDDDWEPTNPVQHYKSVDEEKYEGLLGEDDDGDDDDDDAPPVVRLPPNRRFPALHQQIKDAIAALGGVVAPKLNWSAPKDAAELMEQKNTMRCRTPDDVYFILKSSSFVSHDLEHAFDGTVDEGGARGGAGGPGGLGFAPVLVLRAYFDLHTALEFRCFVKQRNLVAITPRDLKHYPYLEALRKPIVARAQALFRSRLQFAFPAGNFVFDIYIPEAATDTDGAANPGHHDTDAADGGAGGSRLSWARLIDINPWALRTDTLLFSWHELLTLSLPRPFLGIVGEGDADDAGADHDDGTDSGASDDDDDADYEPELRLVDRDDPAAVNFSSAPYSAHKLPKEVVDASLAGEGGLREFAQQWQTMVASRERRPGP